MASLPSLPGGAVHRGSLQGWNHPTTPGGPAAGHTTRDRPSLMAKRRPFRVSRIPSRPHARTCGRLAEICPVNASASHSTTDFERRERATRHESSRLPIRLLYGPETEASLTRKGGDSAPLRGGYEGPGHIKCSRSPRPPLARGCGHSPSSRGQAFLGHRIHRRTPTPNQLESRS